MIPHLYFCNACNQSYEFLKCTMKMVKNHVRFMFLPLASSRVKILYIISYDVAGVFNVIKTSNVAIPWIENRLRFSVVGFGFTWLPIGC